MTRFIDWFNAGNQDDKRSVKSQALSDQILKLEKEKRKDCLTDWNHNQMSNIKVWLTF